jgi:hypothetical protein
MKKGWDQGQLYVALTGLLKENGRRCCSVCLRRSIRLAGQRRASDPRPCGSGAPHGADAMPKPTVYLNRGAITRSRFRSLSIPHNCFELQRTLSCICDVLPDQAKAVRPQGPLCAITISTLSSSCSFSMALITRLGSPQERHSTTNPRCRSQEPTA